MQMNDEVVGAGRGVHAVADGVPRVVDAGLLGDVAARQLAAGVAVDGPFVLLDLDDDGLRLAVVDPRAEVVVAQRRSPEIRPHMLDRMLADHLIDTGRVDEPTGSAWMVELVDLAARGRARLAASDSTFLLGRDHVRYFRVARRDLDEATMRLAAEVARRCAEIAAAAPESVTSVVMRSAPETWPGLDAALTRCGTPPVVLLADSDAGRTELTHAVDVPSVVDTDQLSAHPTTPPEIVAAEVAGVLALRPSRRTRILLGAAAVGAIIGIGGGVAVAVTGDGTSSGPALNQAAPTTATTSSGAYADPADFAEARQTPVRYVPPPPPVETTVDRPSRQGPIRQRTRPPRITIPNPIPGLPPIVFP